MNYKKIGIMFLVFTVLLVVSSYNYNLFNMITNLIVFVIGSSIFFIIQIHKKKVHSSINLIAWGFLLSGSLFMISVFFYNGLTISNIDNMNFSYGLLLIGHSIFSISLIFRILSIEKGISSNLLHITLIMIMFVLIILNYYNVFPVLYVDDAISINLLYLQVINLIIYGAVIFGIIKSKQNYDKAFFFEILAGLSLVVLSVIFCSVNTTNTYILNLLSRFTWISAYYLFFRAFTITYLIKPIDNNFDQLIKQISKLKDSAYQQNFNDDLFRQLYEEAPLGYQSLDSSGKIIIVNDTYARLLGYTKNEMIGKFFGEFMDEESKSRLPDKFKSFLATGSVDVIFNMIHKNGNKIATRFIGKIAKSETGEFKQTHCILMDVSSDIAYHKGVIKSKKKVEDLVLSLQPAVYIVNKEEKCAYINDVALDMLGFSKEEILDKNSHELFHHSNIDGSKMKQDNCPIFHAVKSKNDVSLYDQTFFRKDGEKVSVLINTSPIVLEGVTIGTLVSFTDKGENKDMIEGLMYMSMYDHLTGIFNRRYYEQELNNLDKNENYPLSIVLADVNGLKLINDAFGHLQGDIALIETARLLSKEVCSDSIVSRIGGDEFAVIAKNKSKEEILKTMQKIHDNAKKIKIKGVTLSLSLGFASKVDESKTINELFTEAEDWMYREKLNQVPSNRSVIINTIIATLNQKDVYSEMHSRKVSEISVYLATKLGFDVDEINNMKTAGLLHDIGKIIIPTKILIKKGKLTDSEYNEMKKHPEIGFRILNSVSKMRDIANFVFCHHEWIDGTGYPRGLKKLDIPIQSRIISVADSLDAMLSNRLYRKKLTKEEAKQEIIDFSGKQFCKDVVNIAVENFDELYNLITFEAK